MAPCGTQREAAAEQAESGGAGTAGGAGVGNVYVEVYDAQSQGHVMEAVTASDGSPT